MAKTPEELIRDLAHEDRSIRFKAVQELVRISEPAVKPLIAVLDDETLDTGWLVDVLKQIGKPAVEPLIEALDDPRMVTQQRAALALGSIGDDRAIDPLIKALKDDDIEVRAEAASSLGGFLNADAVEPLLVALEEEAAAVRAKAAWSLGNFDDIRIVDHLLVSVQDADAVVRRGAIWSLAKLDSQRAADAFRAALKDEDSEVRQLAAVALRKLGGDEPALEQYMATANEVTGEVENVLDALQDASRLNTTNLEALRHSNPRVRERLLEALSQKGGKISIDALLPALNDINPAVRTTAIHSLTKIGEPAVAPLIEALEHKSKYVRSGAAQVLGNLKDPRAVMPLIALLEDQAAAVRHDAAESLGRLRDERAVNPLKSTLSDSDQVVRVAVEAALLKLGYEPGGPQEFFRKLFGKLRGGR